MLSSVPLKPFSVATLLAVHETNTRKDYKPMAPHSSTCSSNDVILLTTDVIKAKSPQRLGQCQKHEPKANTKANMQEAGG